MRTEYIWHLHSNEWVSQHSIPDYQLSFCKGFCDATSTLAAPPDFPTCGFYGDLCPEEVAPFPLPAILGIVLACLLAGGVAFGYVIRLMKKRSVTTTFVQNENGPNGDKETVPENIKTPSRTQKLSKR